MRFTTFVVLVLALFVFPAATRPQFGFPGMGNPLGMMSSMSRMMTNPMGAMGNMGRMMGPMMGGGARRMRGMGGGMRGLGGLGGLTRGMGMFGRRR